MKKTLLLLILLSVIPGLGQFQKTVISNTNTNGAYGLLEKDLDGDGDLDLIGTSENDNTVAYFINDGNGGFAQTIVDNSLTGARSADAADFDGDGDMDFVAIGTTELVWYLNDNASFTKTTIETGLNNPHQVRLYDIGDLFDPGTPDGDMDIGLLISGDNIAVAYFNDGNNDFTRITVLSVNDPRYLHGGNFNGDSNDDMLVSSYSGNKIEWHKIGSLGLVLGGTVASNFNGALGVEGGDIDLDGDDDVIAAAYIDNKVSWFENIDGTGNSFIEHVIDSNLPGASYVHWLDIDFDGDKDIVATGYGNVSGSTVTDTQVVVYYNDGTQYFTKTVIDNTVLGATTFVVKDFNGDNTYDIAVAANVSDEFVLFSGTPNAIDDLANSIVNIYPNPATDVINIYSEKAIDKVTIFDITGRRILETNKRSIDITGFYKGYYLVKVKIAGAVEITKKILVLR